MPVVCEGERIGRIQNVVLTPDFRALLGLQVDCGLRGRRFVGAQGVKMLGDVAVLVERYPARSPAPEAVFPRRALSCEGARLGCITGAWLDEATREVVSLELSGGLFEDLRTGRTQVRFYHVQADSGEIIVCPEGGEEA